ncbi:hypothetical protein K466DRAFT_377261 [Polyporus arcularius HHB13444]|uniref:Uncharacterized protein n=1 Tax=Polyporus arcularius HHB13444 TaxID=1314778 RepID=A0A5C3Q1T7_9APHY|nr:hypothetical protein K466DRAFT_377261 [Polyporus arcularius HHB13444]
MIPYGACRIDCSAKTVLSSSSLLSLGVFAHTKGPPGCLACNGMLTSWSDLAVASALGRSYLFKTVIVEHSFTIMRCPVETAVCTLM